MHRKMKLRNMKVVAFYSRFIIFLTIKSVSNLIFNSLLEIFPNNLFNAFCLITAQTTKGLAFNRNKLLKKNAFYLRSEIINLIFSHIC